MAIVLGVQFVSVKTTPANGSSALRRGLGFARVIMKRRYGFPASQAAHTRHSAIAAENTTGTAKKYTQLRIVTVMKHAARDQFRIHIVDKASFGWFPSCHVRIAVKRRKTVTNIPKPV
jgi:hypothetical protein